MQTLALIDKLPAEKPGPLDRAPWYEILFWETWFRFRCPPRTWHPPKRHAHWFDQDERPFVNSESRMRYGPGEGQPFQSIIALERSWKLGPRSLLSRRSARLSLQMIGLGVKKAVQAEYPDMTDPEVARRWLTDIYRGKHASLGQWGLLPEQNGFHEVVFINEAIAQAQADAKTYTFNLRDINGWPVHECQPFANYLDFFVPFGPHDMVQFAFSITADDADHNVNQEHILRDANRRVNALMRSLSVEYIGTDTGRALSSAVG